ncbi:MAG: ATP-binding protein [Opitutaceae bacterium]|jgi:signal transduction histidine kinase/CheY-like chemotaxis protein
MDPYSIGPRLGACLFLAIGLSLGIHESPAQDTPSAENAAQGADPAVIQRISDYWDLRLDEQAVLRPIDITLTVFYYDPYWRLMYGEEDGNIVYLPLSATPMAFKAGDRVRIRGKISSNGLVADPDGVTVLPAAKTVPPIEAGGKIDNWSKLSGKLCTVEGLVDQQFQHDPTHNCIITNVDGQKVLLWVLNEPGERVPSYEGFFIRFTGIYQRMADTMDRLTQIEVWVPSPSAISGVSHVSNSAYFNVPIVSIDSFPEAPSRQMVRIVGKVLSQVAGRMVTIRDESAQAVVITPQTELLKPGDVIEAVGIPFVDGVKFRLRQACFRKQPERKASDLTDPAVVFPKLRIIDQVRGLSLDEAAKNHPVRLLAAVTWFHPDADFFFIQDSTGGLRVEAVAKDREGMKIAHRTEIIGQTRAGVAAPIVRASHVKAHTMIDLPDPRSLTLEQALTGIGDAELVEMTGFLRHIGREGNWLRLELSTPSGIFYALLPPGEQTANLANSTLRIKGVCSAAFNDHGRVIGIDVWVKSAADISIQGSMPADPFSLPRQSIASLVRSGISAASNEWVCTRGTVTLFKSGLNLVIQDGPDSLHVLCRSTSPLAEGDEIEIAGLPGREEGHYILREAIYRKTGSRGNIRPVELPPPYSLRDELDWCLVRMEGELFNRSERPGAISLMLKSGKSVFECEMDNPPPSKDRTKSWKPGALLRVTGVYSVRYNEYVQPQNFRLILRSADDVILFRQASWWTLQSAITTAIVLALVSVLGIFWVVLLRQKVREQTSTIRTQMEKESLLVAELERSSRLESLGVLAGGIAHDFNNLLTVIIGNVGLARMERDVEASAGPLLAEVEYGAQRARTLTQQLLTFARGGNPVRNAQPIGSIVRESCMNAIGPSKIACSLNLASDLWPAVVDKDQIVQVIRNIVINAVQAMPNGGTISVDARNEELDAVSVPTLAKGRYVRIAISDTGPGIPEENIGKVFDPFFSTRGGNHGLGLATVRSIVHKHEGYVEVSSPPGTGATVTLWLPAAMAPSPAPAIRSNAPAAQKAIEDASILFMDDEEPIQRMASVLFKRMGCRFAVVGSGEKALDEYIKAKDSGTPFDLVITDLTVPNGMGGKELLNALKKIDPGVRIIVSSGYSSDPVLSNYRDYGFIAMVPKPYLIEDLDKTIRGALFSTTPVAA